MKNKQLFLKIAIFISSFILLVLLGYYNYVSTFNQNAKQSDFSLKNQLTLLVGDNKYSQKIANDFTENINFDEDFILFKDISSTHEISYFYGSEKNLKTIPLNKLKNSKKKNEIIVSEQVYFENHKNKEITLNSKEYNIVGVMDQKFSEVNSIDYMLPAKEIIFSKEKIPYQVVQINSNSKINEKEIQQIPLKYDENIPVSTSATKVLGSKEMNVVKMFFKMYVKDILIFSVLSVAVMIFFYVLDGSKIYKVYYINGKNSIDLFLQILKDSIKVIIIPYVVALLSYFVIVKLNGTLIYFSGLFRVEEYDFVYKMTISYIVIVLILSIVCLKFSQKR